MYQIQKVFGYKWLRIESEVRKGIEARYSTIEKKLLPRFNEVDFHPFVSDIINAGKQYVRPMFDYINEQNIDPFQVAKFLIVIDTLCKIELWVNTRMSDKRNHGVSPVVVMLNKLQSILNALDS